MSDFSSLDLDQPINNSSLTDNLRQPIWIALIASVGVHAILGINLPRLSLFSEQAKLPPTVGLVELTPEQLERLPQPEEPEITFSTIPAPPNLSPGAPTPGNELPSIPQSSSSELPEIPIDPSDYKLPELPPEDSISSSTSTRTRSTPSVSRLPTNQSSIDDYSYNYPSSYPSIPGRSPLPTTPLNTSPLPNTSAPIDIFQNEPPQELNQEQIDESQIRKNLGLTDKVYDSGLSRRQTLEIYPNDDNATVENSTQPSRSYSQNLQLPPRRYQDKQENQVAVTPNNSNTQTEKKPVATATPEAPPKPDPTKRNRLPEAPLVRRLREGKTIQDIVEEKQPEEVAVVTPPPETNNSQPETEAQETPSPAPTPSPSPTPQQPKEYKGSLLDNFQKQRQQQVAETTPTPKPSPKPDDEIAATTLEETKPPTPEVKETPSVAPAPSPESSPVKQPTENKGSLLQKFEEQKQQNAAVAEESESRDIALGGIGAYMEWALELGLTEEENLTKPETISNVYPEPACERKLEGNALVGVLVDADGVVERGPKLLLDSGYAVLDEAALDAVSKRSFSSSDRSKLYQYELNFDSANCTAAQPTPEAESQEKAQPTEEGIPIEVLPPEGE